LGKGAGESEKLERIDTGHESFAGIGIRPAEKVTGQDHQSPDQGGVAVAEEPQRIIPRCPDDPDLRLAAGHAIGFVALGLRKGGATAGAIDHGSQAFLQVLNHREVVEKRLLVGGEWHGPRLRAGLRRIKRALCILVKVGRELAVFRG